MVQAKDVGRVVAGRCRGADGFMPGHGAGEGGTG